MDIKQIIKDHGFTLEQVAALMPNSRTGQPGISRQSLYLAITGNPTINTLKDIASIIGCKVGDFFQDEVSASTVTCPHCGKPITVELNWFDGMILAGETTEEDRTMLNEFFSGIGFVVLFLIALALAVIAIGFKVLLWVFYVFLGFAILAFTVAFIREFFNWIKKKFTNH